MKKQKTNLVVATTVLIFAVLGFMWLGYNSQVKTTSYNFVENKTVLDSELNQIKDAATSLLYNRKNLTSMPIPEPKSKMGKKANPYSE
jgi:hypothetical protein